MYGGGDGVVLVVFKVKRFTRVDSKCENKCINQSINHGSRWWTRPSLSIIFCCQMTLSTTSIHKEGEEQKNVAVRFLIRFADHWTPRQRPLPFSQTSEKETLSNDTTSTPNNDPSCTLHSARD